jgi:hypothetical protein
MKITQAKADATLSAAGRTLTGVAHVAEIAHGDAGTVRHVSFCMELTDDQAGAAEAFLSAAGPVDLTLDDGRRASVHVSGFVTAPTYFAVAGTGYVLGPNG